MPLKEIVHINLSSLINFEWVITCWMYYFTNFFAPIHNYVKRQYWIKNFVVKNCCNINEIVIHTWRVIKGYIAKECVIFVYIQMRCKLNKTGVYWCISVSEAKIKFMVFFTQFFLFLHQPLNQVFNGCLLILYSWFRWNKMF